MFLIKTLILILLACLSRVEGEEKWLSLPLADSYEHEILHGQGAHTMHEYFEFFQKDGGEILHFEVQHELAIFETEENLKTWILEELIPSLDTQVSVETIFSLMQERGWLKLEKGKIAFPRNRLLVLYRKEDTF